MTALLQVRDLSVEFPARTGTVSALAGVSLDVGQGEVVGLAGESGAGKTVLCRAVLGVLPKGAVCTGRLTLAGIDQEDVARKDWAAQVSMVWQDPATSLTPVVRVGRQVAEAVFPPATRGRGRQERAAALLAAVGLAGTYRRFPHQLSTGQRQRVAAALALAGRPRLLLADEPATALDAEVASEVLELLVGSRPPGLAVILVSHDLSMLAGRAARVVVLYAGRVVEEAGATTLFSRPRMPYTRALLAAALGPQRRPHSRLPVIDGQPPDPRRPQSGCAFAPRCSHALPDCRERRPPLVEVAPGHRVACWHPVEGAVA